MNQNLDLQISSFIFLRDKMEDKFSEDFILRREYEFDGCDEKILLKNWVLIQNQ